MTIPITLSKQQRDEADRLAGIELVLPWPDDLDRPALALFQSREASDAERRAALAMLREALEAHDLVAEEFTAEALRAIGAGKERDRPIRVYMLVVLRGRRWLGAKTRLDPPLKWSRAALDEA